MSPPQSELAGCVAAFRSIKTGKNVFMFLIALALLMQLAGFILVEFVGVIDATHEKEPAPTTQQTTAETAEKATERSNAAGAATYWRTMLQWILPAMKFMALASGLLVVITLMFAVKLSIVGRLGGIPGLMSAFFWSLILLAMVTPWQQLLGGAFASGALYNLGYLEEQALTVKESWGAKDVDLLERTVYYARFVAYPVIALLIWLGVMAKFARGRRESTRAVIGIIPGESPGENE